MGFICIWELNPSNFTWLVLCSSLVNPTPFYFSSDLQLCWLYQGFQGIDCVHSYCVSYVLWRTFRFSSQTKMSLINEDTDLKYEIFFICITFDDLLCIYLHRLSPIHTFSFFLFILFKLIFLLFSYFWIRF